MAFDPLSPVEPAAGHLPVAVGAADTANHAARDTGAKKAKGRGTGIQADHVSQARTRPPDERSQEGPKHRQSRPSAVSEIAKAGEKAAAKAKAAKAVRPNAEPAKKRSKPKEAEK